jgi:hypothetical protein
MSLQSGSSSSFAHSLGPQVHELLCDALRRSHRFSKQLRGRLQDEEYQNRADLVSILIISGNARPNGVHANGTVGFDIDIVGDRPYRVHQPLGRLHPEARACLKPQLANVSVTCSLSEHLAAKWRKVARI